MVVELRPIFDAVGQALVVHDDQQIIVGLIALGGVRLIDPAAAGIAAIENDLRNAALALPVLSSERQRLVAFLETALQDQFELALLLRRELIEHAQPFSSP